VLPHLPLAIDAPLPAHFNFELEMSSDFSKPTTLDGGPRKTTVFVVGLGMVAIGQSSPFWLDSGMLSDPFFF
jgi:hypothetical protein